MAENFATFDYKTLEEVLTVIKYLTSVLSTTGMQLLEIISPSHLLTHLHGSQPVPTNTTEPQAVSVCPLLLSPSVSKTNNFDTGRNYKQDAASRQDRSEGV